jgi:hypothetical protein
MTRLRTSTADLLALILAVAVLVMFIPRPWINPALFQSGLFLLGGIWAIALVVRPFELRFRLPLIPLAGAVAWGVLQLAAHWTTGRADTRAAVSIWLGNLLAFFLALQVCASARVRRRFLDTLVAFAFVLSVVSVVQYFSQDGKIFWLFPTYDSVVLGPFVNRDQYAAFIEMVLPLALVQALGGGSRALGFRVVSAAMYASVIAGASRAGALLVTAELVLVPLLGHGRKPAVALWGSEGFIPLGGPKGHWSLAICSLTGGLKPTPPGGAGFSPRGPKGDVRQVGKLRDPEGTPSRPPRAVSLWLLAIVFVAVAGWAVLWNRFQDPDPLQGRREMLADTVAMIHARPWAGFGLGTFRTRYPAYASVDFGAVVNHAHNDWAEWAADGGLPFSLLLLSIAIWTIPAAFRTVWGIGIVAVFIHGIVDFPLQKPVLELWLFTLLGALAAETGPIAGPN